MKGKKGVSMEKTRFIALIVFIGMLLPLAASANSGPVYMKEAPSYAIMTLEDCPVTVTHEKLTFAMSAANVYGWGPLAQVTAAYQMENPTDKAQHVPMAFPFVTKLNRNALENIRITVNGAEVPYQVRLGQSLADQDFLQDPAAFIKAAEMGNILSTVSKPPYAPTSFDDNAPTPLYTIAPAREHARYKINIKFKIDPAKTKVVAYGINSIAYGPDGNCELSAWYYEDNPGFDCGFLVLGEDTVREMEIFTTAEGEEDKEATAKDRLEKMQVVPREYIAEKFIKADASIHGLTGEEMLEQAYGIVAAYMDSLFANGNIITDSESITEPLRSRERVIVLLYAVPFEPQGKNEVMVSYTAGGTLDRRNSKDYTYTYAYILNPARGWADFGGLEVEVLPASAYPYIVSSTLPFARQEDGRYTAGFDGLPDTDLVFTMYTEPEITFTDRIFGPVGRRLPYYLPLLIPVVVLVAAGAALGIVIRIRKQQG